MKPTLCIAAVAAALALPPLAGAADWQSCSNSLSAVRSDTSNAQREADAAVRSEREVEAARRDLDTCRTGGRDPHNDTCRTAQQTYESRRAAHQSQVRTVEFQLSILDRSVSGAGLACGKNLRLLPAAPPAAK